MTPEQKTLISVYWSKWRQIWLSTERIDRKKATEAVLAAYAWMNLSEPEIIFCESPYAACGWIWNKLSPQIIENWQNNSDTLSLGNLLWTYIYRELVNPLFEQIESEVSEQLGDMTAYAFSGAGVPFNSQLCNCIVDLIATWVIDDRSFDKYRYIESQIRDDSFQPENHYWIAGVDYCISVLALAYPEKEWEIYQSLVKNCSWIFHFGNTAIICDRPTKLSFDNQNYLHAEHTEGEAAIQFTDGFSIYAYHWVALPDKYVKLHPSQWQAKWFLEESNSELCEALIQSLGCKRIIEELQAVELDSYKEYTLYKLNYDTNYERTYLIKMIEPNTETIYVVRIPFDLTSLQEVIPWVDTLKEKLIKKIDLEIKRLGWSLETCQNLLIQLTGKKRRFTCTYEELEHFLVYLQNQTSLEMPDEVP